MECAPPWSQEPAFVAIVSGTGFKRSQFCIDIKVESKVGKFELLILQKGWGLVTNWMVKGGNIKDDLQILVTLLWRW